MAELYKHIFISGNAKAEKYKTSPKRGKTPQIPVRERAMHSEKLLLQFEEIWKQKALIHETRSAEKITTKEGTYLSFKSAADYDLITKSLENFKKGIRLLNIKEELLNGNHKQIKATVYIPNGMESFFINKIIDYQNKNLKTGKPKNEPLVNSIEDVSISLLEGLWTDNAQTIPSNNSKWCEVWLNVNTKTETEKEQISDFIQTLENIGIEYKNNILFFPERVVLLINANRIQLIELMLESDLLAEFRAGQELAGFWVNENRTEQEIWVDELLNRIVHIDSNVKVCILDTGVNNGHSLLQLLLNEEDTLTVNNSWGTNDHFPDKAGHGTLMSGIAGFGNLENALTTTKNIVLTHKLCSVKILPPPNEEETAKELWGDITSQGIALAEIQNPGMLLIYCMAVTSKYDAEKGRPSSWSCSIDNLIFGNNENQRLIIVSAGNILNEEDWKNYPNSNFVTSIENPAQSWNAITVGAYTEKVIVSEEIYVDFVPLANSGELSPYSSTSLVWETKWPIKPDIVFEGGNLLISPDGSISRHDDLELLSTSKSFNTKPLDTLNATSAATAQASWFAAKIVYEYPNAWPETIRGLMIHSAFWNNSMFQQLNIRHNNKSDYKKLLRVFGFGIPDIERALYSKESALTFIVQESIQPFGFNIKNKPETNEIHFFNFPWPKEILLSLGNIPVKLKITLSYFIEPGAGEIGWKDKYRYQSHGLRFDINNIGEEEEDFRKRINIEARDIGELVNSNSGSSRWALGVNNRATGSIHSDYWDGTASDIATCNLIAVYPIIGWWRERINLKMVETSTRYTLIVSLETPEQEVELYSTIKQMIEIPIEINTN